jgi:hypothetical protein
MLKPLSLIKGMGTVLTLRVVPNFAAANDLAHFQSGFWTLILY